MGHYILSVVASDHRPSRVDWGPQLAASYSQWASAGRRPDLSNGGLHLPVTGGGLLRLAPPIVLSACTAVTLGAARDDSVSGPRKILMKLHVN